MRSLVEPSLLLICIAVFLSLGQKVQEKLATELDPRPHKAVKTKSTSRAPASIPAIQTPKIKPNSHSKIAVDLDCQFSIQPGDLKQQQRFVRFTGSNCEHFKSSSQIKIRNVNDGVSAQIFWHKTNTFSSEVIKLKDGDNSIEVAWHDHLATPQKRLFVFHHAQPKK